jgi:protein transport protein SEC61 subunit gamma-like protein
MSGIVEKGWDVQRRVEERAKRLGKGRFGRVLKMARKPTTEEYSRVVMITGLGLVLIGLAGFVIYWVMKYGRTWLAGLFH